MTTLEEKETRDTLKQIDDLRKLAETAHDMYEHWMGSDSELKTFMDVLLKVYDALHSQGIRGPIAIRVIKAIDERNVMFVEKP